MMISDLEHLEMISQEIGVETPRKVSGGFAFIWAQAQAFAQGSEAAITMVTTQAFTFKFPI
mgnify:CR=1 FL=1